MAEQRAYTGTEHLAPRRPNPGRIVRNRGIAALSVAVAGYLLGFLLPLALGWTRSNATTGRLLIMPVGGIASLMLAFTAVYTARKVRAFIDAMPPLRRQYVCRFMDPDLERRRATLGMALGIAAVAANPLIGFAIYYAAA